MSLRGQIAEVLYQRPDYPSGMAEEFARDAATRRADAVLGVVEARVRELEEENEKLRGDLEHATEFRYGPLNRIVLVDRKSSFVHEKGWFWVVRDLVAPEKVFEDVTDALARAREIAGEEG